MEGQLATGAIAATWIGLAVGGMPMAFAVPAVLLAGTVAGALWMVVPVVLTVYSDRSFSFEVKSSPAAVLLKKAAGLAKGSGNASKETVGTVTAEQVRQIAQTKMQDLNAFDIDAAVKVIEGTARSMGIKVEG